MLILYYILPQKRTNSGAFLSVLRQLPTEKTRQIRRLRNRQAQLQSIIGLALVKAGIQQSGLRGFHLRKLRFVHQKPYIHQGSHFSISHSKQCICCVVSNNQPVGIDIEKIRPLTASLVKKYCLKNNNGQNNDTAPITVWTQKEAILKVHADNTLNELKQIDIYNNKAYFKNQSYRVQSFRLAQKYTMSIATTQPITKLKIKRVYF